MSSDSIYTLKQNEYFHGTGPLAAIQILFEGFKVQPEEANYGKRGTFGSAIYLTKSAEIACVFSYSNFIFKCKLSQGVRILHHTGDYDTKTVDYLKKEFGKDILTGHIEKVLPRNKHLTQKELIALMNYRYVKINSFSFEHWGSLIASVRKQLKRHKIDAIGETKDVVGVAVINPSLLTPITLYKASGVQRYYLSPLDPAKFAISIDQEIQERKQLYLEIGRAIPLDYYDHISDLLHRYCQQHNIDLTKRV